MPDELIDDGLKLPSLPVVLTKLNHLLSSGIPSMSEVGAVIREDPALAARVLQIVNSPLFPYRALIDSVQRAVTLLGVREVRNVAMTAWAVREFSGIPATVVDMTRFWRHSLYCALVSRGLARAAGLQEIERYFLYGLLHDLGSLVIYQQQPERARQAIEMSQREKRSLADTETEVLGFNHADVGSELMLLWNMPDSLVEAVRHHHADMPPSRQIAVLRLADRLVDQMPSATLGVGYAPDLIPEDWARAALDPSIRDVIISDAAKQFDGAHKALLAA